MEDATDNTLPMLLLQASPRSPLVSAMPALRLRLGRLTGFSLPKEETQAMTPDPVKYQAAKRRLRKQLAKIIRDSEELYRHGQRVEFILRDGRRIGGTVRKVKGRARPRFEIDEYPDGTRIKTEDGK